MSLPPLECIYVTEECLREWKSGGNPNFRVPKPVPPLRFLCELCWTLVRGELPFQKCQAALDFGEFTDKVSVGALGSTLADVVTLMAQDVHWKWSQRISRLLIQCLESTECMEIRGALILQKYLLFYQLLKGVELTLKSGIKSEEREDLRVLATGVAAALAARKSSWVSDEEFSVGYVELNPPSAVAKSSTGNIAIQNSSLSG